MAQARPPWTTKSNYVLSRNLSTCAKIFFLSVATARQTEHRHLSHVGSWLWMEDDKHGGNDDGNDDTVNKTDDNDDSTHDGVDNDMYI